MLNHVFISFSAVQIYDLFIYFSCSYAVYYIIFEKSMCRESICCVGFARMLKMLRPSLAVYKNDDLKFVVVQQRAPLVKVIISDN